MDRMEEAKELFTIAEEDLSSAQILMEKHCPTPDNVICNLCQQAGEKFLKGYLISKGISFEKIHNIVILLKLCENAESGFAALQDKCSYLTPFAVIPRYSYELQLNQNDAKVAIQYANDIKEFVKETLRQELKMETKQ